VVHNPRMKKILAVAASFAVIFVAATGCSSKSSSSASPSSTTAAPASGSGGSTTSTKAAASGGDAGAFCTMLAADTDKTAAFAASIGTPEQAAKLAEVKADNDAVLAAAPSDIHDAVAKVYAVSEIARKALDTSLSPAEKRAAGSEAAAAVGTPEVKAAIADYKTWVQANCGDLSAKILAGGL
jgi:hypothetical protein